MNDENSPVSVDVIYIVEVGGDLVRNKVLSKITQPRLFSKKLYISSLISKRVRTDPP